MVDQESSKQESIVTPSLRAVVLGEALREWPKDLFIPPAALEVVIDSFEGPLDLLLYLIRKQNIDILDIPVAQITDQYMAYIELMHAANLDLAAEYLVMAAVLAEIKSRMLLPKPRAEEDDEHDPRLELVQRLQEYERFSSAANQLDDRPRLERDILVAHCHTADNKPVTQLPQASLEQLVNAFQRILDTADANTHLQVTREILSVRERMTDVLRRLNDKEQLRFEELFCAEEGRLGIVVTFVALLELFRDDLLILVQTKPFQPLHVRRVVT